MARVPKPVPPSTPATDPVSLAMRRGSTISMDAPTEGSLTTSVATNPIPRHGTPPLFIPGGRLQALATPPNLPTDPPAATTAPTDPAANPIVQENQLPGNPSSEWQVNADSTNIEGFTSDISVDHGQTLNLKIDTNSTNYRIDIYRLGYYGGNGARKVATLQHQNPSAPIQPDPFVDTTTGEVDAGNWSVTDSWNVPATAVSGVYVANLVRQDGISGVFQVPFIVRNHSSTSNIVFQTSDTTWQAYNGWGGANLYGGNGPGPNGAAYAVSYNRPIMTRDGVGTFAGPQDFLFGAEYPAIRWMEENGYDVSYISGLDTARSGSLLLNHKIFTSTGHDEYWSGDQRANVQAALAAGVNLAFMSGNEVYWKTRWAPSIDGSNTPNRTMITYKETHAFALNPNNPAETWTGTWRDPSFSPPADGGRPENALTGTETAVDAYRADTITVPYGETQLRLWRNTAVAQTQPGQTASLTQNLLGYEWDASPDNGFRPAGLIDLSSTTLPVSTSLLDYGNRVGQGTVTHNLTLYRAPTGALAFGAGTVFWSWGLDANHDLTTTPIDPNVQQATVNLFADMGVQPQTLQASLVPASQSTDHTPPTSAITTPAGSSFPEGQNTTITGSSIDTGGGMVGGVEVSTDGGTTWHPAGGTASNWTYTWDTPGPGTYNIKSRATDDSVNTETPGPGITVTVTPTATVTLFQNSDTPAEVTANDNKSAELGVKFTPSVSGTISGFRIYEGPQNIGTQVANLWTATGTLLGSATFSSAHDGWQQVNLATPVSITAGNTYVASYHSNGFYSDTANYFVVPHTSGVLTDPASNAQGPDGVFAYGASSTFPTKGVESATNYWVDVVFNPPASLFQSTDTPATVTVNDPVAAELGVKFTASSAGTINGIRFYKGPQNTGTHVVDLWSSTGTKLASATTTNETASGWQEADFTTPASITPGTTYVAAYHTNTGFYSADSGYFNNTRTTGPLTAPSSGTSGGNGVYAYSAGDTFPNNTFKASNYWVDPVFQPQLVS
jgi:hypothetical protein